MPKASIVIPAYNAANTLPEAIDSVLSQTYQDFQLIIVNDGSGDETGEIIDGYARKDSRIIAYHQENKGVGKTRNIGIEMADGEWIGFLGADDVWLRNKLELQFRVVNQYPNASVIVTKCIDYNETVSEDDIKGLNILPVKHLDDIFEVLVLRDFPFPPSSAIIMTEDLRRAGCFTDDKVGEDFLPFMLLALQNKGFYLIELSPYKVRASKGSLSRSPWSRYLGARARVLAISYVLENQKLYEKYLNPERIEILKRGFDKYLKWTLSGARQFMRFDEYFKVTFEHFSQFNRKGNAIKEKLKTLLFPGVKMLRSFKQEY
jgi:glycosyltransferase involved in cell wall biosynthesis